MYTMSEFIRDNCFILKFSGAGNGEGGGGGPCDEKMPGRRNLLVA